MDLKRDFCRLLLEKKRRLAGRSLIDFLEYESSGEWQRAKHLEYLCQKVEEVERGELKRLMVFMPPRHGKSEVISKKFPAWYLGRNPEKEVILTSYAAELAYDFSRIARETLREQGFNVFNKELAQDNQAVKRWGIKSFKGGLTAAGVGGPITGRGANVAIIDDPIKNWQEAASPVFRERTWNWYQSVLRTRLTPAGAIILIMTRWHENDLAGRLLKQEADRWEVVNFPAIAEEEDIIGRSPGEVLWPERYDLREISDIKNTMMDLLFDALYQQKPRKTIDNALWNYDIIHRVDKPPQLDRIVVAVDPAATSNELSSDTGIIVAGRGIDGRGYILADRTIKGSPGSWGQQAVTAYHSFKADRIVGEVNNGGDMVEHVIRSVDRTVSYKGVRASRGKLIRAEPIAALYEQSPPVVYHVGKFEKLEEELTTWEPGMDSPDRLDAMVWALSELMLKPGSGSYYSQNYA